MKKVTYALLLITSTLFSQTDKVQVDLLSDWTLDKDTSIVLNYAYNYGFFLQIEGASLDATDAQINFYHKLSGFTQWCLYSPTSRDTLSSANYSECYDLFDFKADSLKIEILNNSNTSGTINLSNQRYKIR